MKLRISVTDDPTKPPIRDLNGIEGFVSGMETSAEILRLTLANVKQALADAGFPDNQCCTLSVQDFVESVTQALDAAAAKVKEKL